MIMRILIVEDEPPILRGIVAKIKKALPKAPVIYTAANGQDAISLLQTTEVDIVLTDINMPLVTGIELLDHITNHYPTIRTIILTGYPDFKYAQQAVKLGAYDYLLKPLDLVELKKLLEKLQKEIGEAYLAHLFYKDYLHAPSTLMLFDTPVYLLSICIGLLPLRGVPPNTSLPSWDGIKLDLGNCLEVDSKYANEKLLVIPDLSKEDVTGFATTLMEQLVLEISPVTITISPALTSLESFYDTYKLFASTVYKHMALGHSKIVDLETITNTTSYTLSPTREKKFRYALEKKQLTHFKDEIASLVERIKPLQPSPETLETLATQILQLCYQTDFIPPSSHKPLTIFYPFLFETTSCEVVFTLLLEHIVAAIHQDAPTKAKSTIGTQDKAYLVNEIEAFIQKHITENISNQTLSEQFGLVPSYISKLFKTHTGISPSEYILSLRIEKAKVMLMESPHLRSKDIAEILGYTDPLYFSRVFKKSTGIYPSEYRKETLKKSTV